MDTNNLVTIQQVQDICGRVSEIFAGKSPEVQGAALADLLAMWLAGHHYEGDIEDTNQLREELLAMHLDMVRKLLPVNARIIGTTTTPS